MTVLVNGINAIATETVFITVLMFVNGEFLTVKMISTRSAVIVGYP